MASRRLPSATDKWERTSEPAVYYEKDTSTWRLFLNFTPRPREKAPKKKAGPKFSTRENAIAGMLDFRMGWVYSHRGKVYKRKESEPSPPSTETVLPAGKSRNSLGNLNAIAEQKYKRQRSAGSKLSRADFALLETLSERQQRSVTRGWSKREGRLRRHFDKRGSYLGHRIFELSTHLDLTAEHIARLEKALASQNLASLLVPLPPVEGGGDADETGGEGGGEKEEVSAAQANRLWSQGYSTLEVLREEQKRDRQPRVGVPRVRPVRGTGTRATSFYRGSRL